MAFRRPKNAAAHPMKSVRPQLFMMRSLRRIAGKRQRRGGSPVHDCANATAGIDLVGSDVISPPPVPTTAAPRIAPRLQVAIAGAIAGPIAGVMTKPDRLSTASAIAQASG